ncbi:MAG: transglutaminase family protein [Acidimicrobiia bacterium]|nr:transglutaminase family protein [Acidimicrobiia bacterium]
MVLTPGGPDAGALTAAFAEVAAGGDPARLEQMAFLLGAHGAPEADVAGAIHLLDHLAGTCPGDDAAALVHHLFVDERFSGNVRHYYDPRNSYLQVVLDRRTGIPISLAVVALCVARRLGIGLHGVGVPGHFVLGTPEGQWFDPFHGGGELTLDDLRQRAMAAPTPGGLCAAHLLPADPEQILNRMLANLISVFQAAEDRAGLLWVVRLRTCLPGASTESFGQLARVLASVGRFLEAAAVEEQLASVGGAADREPDHHRQRAAALRARTN